MNTRFLAAVAALAAGAGLAVGQGPATDPVAVPISAFPPPGAVIPAGAQMAKDALYFHSGAAPGTEGPQCPHGCDNRHWCTLCGICGDDKCGFACAPNVKQAFKASGGPDCFYFNLDLVEYYFRSMPLAAPLLTAGPIGSSGRLVEDGVRVLIGNQNVDFGPHASLRTTIGFWGRDRVCGFEASAFLTEQRSEVSFFDGPITGRTVLARPNIDALNDIPSSVLISSPPAFGGTAGFYANSRVGGAEFSFLRNWCYYDRIKFNTLLGARWMVLNEQLRLDSNSVLTDVNPPDPPVVDITDLWATRNNFYGLQVGFQAEFRRGRWFTDITAKIAGGFTHEKLNQSGFTRFQTGPDVNVIPFGAFNLEPNSGRFSEKEESYVPEFIFKLGYQWTQRLSTTIGYNALYISRVVRPGDQINPLINPTLLPVSEVFNPQFPFGPPEPALKFDSSDFFLQGFSFGLTFRY